MRCFQASKSNGRYEYPLGGAYYAWFYGACGGKYLGKHTARVLSQQHRKQQELGCCHQEHHQKMAGPGDSSHGRTWRVICIDLWLSTEWRKLQICVCDWCWRLWEWHLFWIRCFLHFCSPWIYTSSLSIHFFWGDTHKEYTLIYIYTSRCLNDFYLPF